MDLFDDLPLLADDVRTPMGPGAVLLRGLGRESDVQMLQAVDAATQAGYPDFAPDSCMINQYLPGNKMGLHQDRDERDLRAPVVSLSLGLPAVFLFGGLQRTSKTQRYRLAHGDVVVWGGPSRLAFHGILPLADGDHALLGRRRVNVTFRRVLHGAVDTASQIGISSRG